MLTRAGDNVPLGVRPGKRIFANYGTAVPGGYFNDPCCARAAAPIDSARAI